MDTKELARQTAHDFNRMFMSELREGMQAGEAWKKAFEGVGKKSVFALLTEIRPGLHQMSGEGQKAAGQAMVAFAAELERKKQLPKGAMRQVLAALEHEIPGFAKYMSEHAEGTAKEVAAAMRLKSAESNLAGALKNLRAQWGLFNVSTEVTGANWLHNTGVALKDLKKIYGESTGSARKEAEKEIDLLQKHTHDMLTSMKNKTDTDMKQWAKALHAHIPGAVAQASKEVGNLSNNIVGAINAGLLGTEEGGKLIAEAVVTYMKSLGVKDLPSVPKLTHQIKDELKNWHTTLVGVTGEAHAGGGLVQIGQRGDRGRDTIPLNVGGQGIVVGSGEQVAVFNHEQQGVANAMLAPIGGLQGLFSTYNKPHYMAAGGFTPRQAYPGPMGRLDQGVDFTTPGPVRAVLPGVITHTGLWPGWPGTGGIVYATAKGDVYVMEHFQPSVKQGAQVAAGQLIGYALPGYPWIETGWANASGTGPLTPYAGHADGTPMPGARSFASFLGGGPGEGGITGAVLAAPKLKVPHVPGTGPGSKLANAALAKMTHVANQVLKQHPRAVSGPTGEFRGKGTFSKQELEKVWVAAGGSPAKAHLMAAIALAESSGDPRNVGPQTTGGRAEGLWQIMMPTNASVV